jgi:hypothetical protein
VAEGEARRGEAAGGGEGGERPESNEEGKEVVWARAIGARLTDGGGRRRPADGRKVKRRWGGVRVRGGEETARLNGEREGRAAGARDKPCPGPPGQPAGTEATPAARPANGQAWRRGEDGGGD